MADDIGAIELNINDEIYTTMGSEVVRVRCEAVDSLDEPASDMELIGKQSVPPQSASTEVKRAAQKQRASQFGIEALEGKGERLSYPAGYPTKLALYGDPVNLMYPLDPPARARNARARFKQFAKNYSQVSSRRIVHTRIVRRLIELGAKPSFNPDDPLDKLLPADLQGQMKKLEKQDGMVIQTLILSKKKFADVAAAKKWVSSHNFKTSHAGKGPDETSTSWRFRQRDPGDFKDGTFRTITVTDGVQAVVGKLASEKQAKSDAGVIDLRLALAKADEDKRIVFGIVLEPDEVDSQGDTVSTEEIESACHTWLAKFQNRGFMHKKIVNSKIEIYESYLAPINLTIGGQKVKKGTWLLMLHVKDDEMWRKIKDGELTGFSMGGFARRVAA